MKRKPIQDVDLESFHSRFALESDRAAALLGGSLLDARLEDLFRSRLANSHNELLNGFGPLSTFSARITLALALQWIDEDTSHDLNVIRDIRNDFAHNLDHDLSFSTQSVVDRCRNLRSSQSHIDGYSEAAKNNPNFSDAIFDAIAQKFSGARWRYQFAVNAIDQILTSVQTTVVDSYVGPNLSSDCYESSSSLRFKIKSTGTVKPASHESPNSP